MLASPCSHGAVTLRFWAVGSLDDVPLFQRLADRFENQSGVRVDITSLAWGNFQFKYFTSMAAGISPDAGITNLGGPFDYGSVGGLLPLNEAFPAESKELTDRFDPKLLDGFKIGDKLYGIPSDITTLILYYRVDLFEKAGVKVPRTWSELNETISKLEGQGYQFYFGFTNGAQWAVNMYTLPYGLSGLHLDASGKPVVDWMDPRYQKGILEALKLWYLHDSPGKDLGGRALGMFAESEPGKAVALMADIDQTATQIHITKPEIDGKWAMAPWPKPDDAPPANVLGGTSYVIFRQSKHPKEAFEWVKFMNSPEVQQEIILDHLNRGDNSNFQMSPIRAIWNDQGKDFWNRAELAQSRPLYDVLRDVVPTLRTIPSVHGAATAAPMEANLLDGMNTYIVEQLNEEAGKVGVSRSQLIQGWGRGKWLESRQAIEDRIAAKLKAGYADIAPKALAKLDEETTLYQEKYGKVIGDLDRLEHSANALTYAKDAVGLILIGGILTLAFNRKLRPFVYSYFFVGAPVLLALVFVYIPAIVALYLSFTEYHPVMPLASARWTGFKNYFEILGSGDLTNALKRTTLYALITVPLGIMLSLLFAYLLSGQVKASRFWRFLYFSPIVTSTVAIALIFSQLFLGSKQGWLNIAAMSLGLARDPVPFLTNEHLFLPSLMVVAIWQGLAFTILVFLAGFQQVPQELHEAASVDGATQARRFWSVAVPGIRPQVFFISVLGVIGAFQVFETIYLLANKSGDAVARFGPSDSGQTVVPLLYHYGFETYEMGKSAATAYVLFAIVLVLTAIQLRVYRKGDTA